MIYVSHFVNMLIDNKKSETTCKTKKVSVISFLITAALIAAAGMVYSMYSNVSYGTVALLLGASFLLYIIALRSSAFDRSKQHTHTRQNTRDLQIIVQIFVAGALVLFVIRFFYHAVIAFL